MSRSDTIQKIEKNKIIVITRGIYGEELLRLSEALYEGGIRAFEITYDPADPNTLDTIKKIEWAVAKLYKWVGEPKKIRKHE